MRPLRSTELTRAPLSSNSTATGSRPSHAERWRGVRLSPSAAFGSAPHAIVLRSRSSRPWRAKSLSSAASPSSLAQWSTAPSAYNQRAIA